MSTNNGKRPEQDHTTNVPPRKPGQNDARIVTKEGSQGSEGPTTGPKEV